MSDVVRYGDAAIVLFYDLKDQEGPIMWIQVGRDGSFIIMRL